MALGNFLPVQIYVVVILVSARLVSTVFDLALKPGERIIVELDLTLTHPANLNDLIMLCKSELLINLGPI